MGADRGHLHYRDLGVDPGKDGIDALSSLVRPAVRGFADVMEDPEINGRGLVLHVDGAGSKPIVAYLHYREQGDPSWFGDLIQDVLAMNIDDAAAVGARPLLFADYVVYNSLRIRDQELLPALAGGLSKHISTLGSAMAGLGGGPALAGGETAQAPDQVGTLDVAGTVLSSVKLEDARRLADVQAGAVVIGLRSGGRSRWERGENSGIMCNGLTLARHALLSDEYRIKYPEAYARDVRIRRKGRFHLEDAPDGLGMSVGEALASPTRIFAPVALEVVRRCPDHPMAMAHVTGGGHTKILRMGSGVRYVLDGLPEPDPVFLLIREEGRIDWDEMYGSFNMGVGFEIVAPRECVDEILGAAELHGIGAAVVGRVEAWSPGENALEISSRWTGKLTWRKSAPRGSPTRTPHANGQRRA
ncbi:MAG: AIR synthase-related protein [Conexivisphaera sp.]